jgi:hypothetical protein
LEHQFVIMRASEHFEPAGSCLIVAVPMIGIDCEATLFALGP